MAAPNNFELTLVRPHDDVSRAHALSIDGEGVVESVVWDKLLPPVTLSSDAMEQVERVMKPRFGYKPEVLFVYALDEWDNHAWEDGLSRALRELRRHFHMTFMNVGHLRIEDQPEIGITSTHTHLREELDACVVRATVQILKFCTTVVAMCVANGWRTRAVQHLCAARVP